MHTPTSLRGTGKVLVTFYFAHQLSKYFRCNFIFSLKCLNINIRKLFVAFIFGTSNEFTGWCWTFYFSMIHRKPQLPFCLCGSDTQSSRRKNALVCSASSIATLLLQCSCVVQRVQDAGSPVTTSTTRQAKPYAAFLVPCLSTIIKPPIKQKFNNDCYFYKEKHLPFFLIICESNIFLRKRIVNFFCSLGYFIESPQSAKQTNKLNKEALSTLCLRVSS